MTEYLVATASVHVTAAAADRPVVVVPLPDL